MAVKRMDLKPGFMWTMRKAMLKKDSLITSDLRKGFLERPFRKQAVCIGFYAKNQLDLADKIISDRMARIIDPRIETPRAVNVWEQIVKDKSPHENHEKIRKIFPLLADESSRIAQTFASTYTFWVDNFYSCDKYGRSDATTYKLSRALRFDPDEIRLINKKSGMPYLGQEMKNYASYLLDASD